MGCLFSDGLVDDDLAALTGAVFPWAFSSYSPPRLYLSQVLPLRILKLQESGGTSHQSAWEAPHPVPARSHHPEDSMRRRAGYRSALQANDIPIDENLIINGDFERDIGLQSDERFLSGEPCDV